MQSRRSPPEHAILDMENNVGLIETTSGETNSNEQKVAGNGEFVACI